MASTRRLNAVSLAQNNEAHCSQPITICGVETHNEILHSELSQIDWTDTSERTLHI